MTRGMTTRDVIMLIRASMPPECHGPAVITPVSFSGSPRFKSWLGDERS
jgi:hypothetical protein